MKIRNNNKISTPVLVFLALIIFGATTITAAPGDLDLTFGSGGIVVTSFTNTPYSDFPRSIQVQPDGKIVVCGRVTEYDPGSDESIPVSFFLARYNPDGTLDTSFGTDGKIVAPINSGDELVGEEIALQPDGKIVAVGYRLIPGLGNYFAVNRYNSDGTHDNSFGTDGKVITQVGATARGKCLTIQPDGKIVVAGEGPFGNFAVVRYNPNGSLDTGFGEGGKIITPFGNGFVHAEAVMLQPDGKIVVAGGGYYINSGSFKLLRYNADGSLDPGFGVGGKVTFPNSSFADAVLQPDGRIVVVGTIYKTSTQAMAVVRFNANGSRDTGFASNGVFTSPTFNVVGGIVLQPNGKIVSFVHLGALRLNPNGSLDTGFGSNGVATTNLGNSYGVAGAIQQNGRILFLGFTFGFGIGDIAIARFLGDPIAAPAISGTITYGNAIGPPTLRVVSNVLVSGAGSIPVSILTESSGSYLLSGFGAGSYTVTPSKTGGVNGISSFDAARIAQHAVGANPLTGNQLIVADVSGNGIVTSFDAAQVARYAAGLNNSGSTGNWIFTPVNRMYPSITANIAGEDFIALLMGEVSGNWIDGATRRP